MKQKVIQVLDITGVPIACYEIETMESLITLYKGHLFNITSKGLRDYEDSNPQDQIYEKFRFVVAADQKERELLLKVESVKCYLRSQDMVAKLIELNPYQSVGYLREKLESERNTKIKLVVNGNQLKQDHESLVKNIFEEAIIHIIQTQLQTPYLSLYVKEPGTDSKLIEMKCVDGKTKISELMSQVEAELKIPTQFIYLVYAGGILGKEKTISQCFIQNNSCIYAVDSRKYMKRVPLSEFQRRVAGVKKVKQCNKQIMQKVAEKSHLVTSAEAGKNQEPRSMNKKNRYTYERSGTIMEDLGDDNQYFVQEQMNLESQEFQEFQRRGDKLEQQAKLQSSVQNLAAGFVKSQTKIIELQNSEYGVRIHEQSLISQEDDEEVGFQIESVDKNVQVASNQNGSIVSESKQLESGQTGQPLEPSTARVQQREGLVQEKNSKTVLDQDGHSILTEVERTKTERLTEGLTRKQEQTIVEKDGVKLKIHKQTYEDDEGNTLVEQQITTEMPENEQIQRVYKRSIEEVERDESGNLHLHQREIKQDNEGNSFVAESEVVRDENNQLVQAATSVTSKQNQPDRTVLEYQINIRQKPGKIVIGQSDSVLSREGGKIRGQSSEVIMTEGRDCEVIRKETSTYIDEMEKQIVQETIVEDADGNVTHAKGRMKRVQIDQNGIQQQVKVETYNIDDLLGSQERESETLEGIQVKLTDSIYNSAEIQNAGEKQQTELELKGEQEEGQKQESRGFEGHMLPQQFDIVTIGRARDEIKIRIRYDETVDEVAKKLGDVIGKPGASIHFFKDGTPLQQYQMVSDLDLAPGDKIYFIDD